MKAESNKPVLSAVEGRIRLHVPGLQSPAQLQALAQRLYGIAGVSRVSVSARAGSILVYYDPARSACEDMEARVAAIAVVCIVGRVRVAAAKTSAATRSSYNRLPAINNLAMLGSLVAAFAGSRRMHRTSGKVFLALLALHLLLNRRKLLRDMARVLS